MLPVSYLVNLTIKECFDLKCFDCKTISSGRCLEHILIMLVIEVSQFLIQAFFFQHWTDYVFCALTTFKQLLLLLDYFLKDKFLQKHPDLTLVVL